MNELETTVHFGCIKVTIVLKKSFGAIEHTKAKRIDARLIRILFSKDVKKSVCVGAIKYYEKKKKNQFK